MAKTNNKNTGWKRKESADEDHVNDASGDAYHIANQPSDHCKRPTTRYSMFRTWDRTWKRHQK